MQVSKVVEEKGQGEAQGALNGIKALTEGFGPLLFGGLMALFEGYVYVVIKTSNRSKLLHFSVFNSIMHNSKQR